MLFHHDLDMPHLSGGGIILCSLTQIFTNLCSKTSVAFIFWLSIQTVVPGAGPSTEMVKKEKGEWALPESAFFTSRHAHVSLLHKQRQNVFAIMHGPARCLQTLFHPSFFFTFVSCPRWNVSLNSVVYPIGLMLSFGEKKDLKHIFYQVCCDKMRHVS